MLKGLKQFAKTLPVIGPGLTRLWLAYQFRKANPTRKLRQVFQRSENIQVVQVGSNDGKTADPLRNLLKLHHSWRALFIEPVPFLFEKLCSNYGSDPRFCFENVAVAEKAGMVTFYYVSRSASDHLANLPVWYDQLGSFHPNHIIKHLGESIRPYIIAEDVLSMPLQMILDRNRIDHIDLLHIDTEGADWMVLKQLELDRYAPRVILIEHKHLQPEERTKMVHFLSGNYRSTDLGGDFFFERLATPLDKLKTPSASHQ